MEILEHRRLGRIRNGSLIPNVACCLLFAKDPILKFPGCKVRFLRIDGEVEKTGEQYNVIKDIWVEGPVPHLIVETAKVLESQLREFSRLDSDGKFYTAPEYPREAWYEAIVNACVHRSYGLKNMNVFVKMFDDKLVVESPGSFPPFVTPTNIYSSHCPRNPHLMNAMFYLDFVKCHNEGTQRMRDRMAEVNLPTPEFQQSEVAAGYTSVRVTLRNKIKQRKVWVDSDVSRVIGEALTKELSQEEIRILNFVAEHGSINVSECQRLIPTIQTWHSAKRMLTKLAVRGVLRHIHRDDVDRDPDAKFVIFSSPAQSKKSVS